MNLQFAQLIIFCHDVTLLADFYSQKLGLTLIGEPGPEWTLLKAGNFEVGLHKIGNSYVPGQPSSNRNNTKMVFAIDEDIHQLKQNLLDQGVQMRDVKDFEGMPYLLCDGVDPEGNVFQLTQARVL